MRSKTLKSFWQAAALGLLAGMRTTSAPLIVNRVLSDHPSGHLAKSTLSFMQSEKLNAALNIFAAAELIADKMPFTPARTNAAGIIARCISGSLAGASIYKATGNKALAGALLGAVTALGATYAWYMLRKNIVQKAHIYDPIIGAVEDLLVIGGGVAFVTTY